MFIHCFHESITLSIVHNFHGLVITLIVHDFRNLSMTTFITLLIHTINESWVGPYLLQVNNWVHVDFCLGDYEGLWERIKSRFMDLLDVHGNGWWLALLDLIYLIYLFIFRLKHLDLIKQHFWILTPRNFLYVGVGALLSHIDSALRKVHTEPILLGLSTHLYSPFFIAKKAIH